MAAVWPGPAVLCWVFVVDFVVHFRGAGQAKRLPAEPDRKVIGLGYLGCSNASHTGAPSGVTVGRDGHSVFYVCGEQVPWAAM